MRRFYQRAVDKLDRLDSDQVAGLVGMLASENELLAVVLDSMALGVLVADNDGQVLMVNGAAERLLPAQRGGYLERPVTEAVSDREIGAFLAEVLEAGDTVEERDFALAGAETRILSFGVRPLVRERRVEGTLIHIDDVTAKRADDARLRRAESLASLTTLAAGVAHEIKNPLGAIGIHLQLIRKRLPLLGPGSQPADADLEAVREEVGVIEEEVERLNQIVVDYLFAIRPMNVDLSLGDVNVVVGQLLAFMAPELEESGVEVDTELAGDMPQVLLDERYFREALLNVITNAVAAMKEVPIDRRRLVVVTEATMDTVSVRITDSGPGIAADVQGKLFEPYFTTRDFGSGLGLTLVYKIVKEHLGEIAVDSREGKGTTFSVTIPVPERRRHLLPLPEPA